MTKEPNKNTYKKMLWYVLFTLILSQLFSALTDFTIIDPILDKFGGKNISIEPINYPLSKEGESFIRVNLVNSGLGKINNLVAEYKLRCSMDDFMRAELHEKSISKGDKDFFEFKADLDTNCSMGSNPTNIDFYIDKKGQCYIKVEEKVSNICTYCQLDVNVYDGYEALGNLTYWYPFSEGNITVGGNVPIENDCLDYETAINKTELTLLPDYNVKITFYDFSIGCIRGDIEKEWCIEYYPELD